MSDNSLQNVSSILLVVSSLCWWFPLLCRRSLVCIKFHLSLWSILNWFLVKGKDHVSISCICIATVPWAFIEKAALSPMYVFRCLCRESAGCRYMDLFWGSLFSSISLCFTIYIVPYCLSLYLILGSDIAVFCSFCARLSWLFRVFCTSMWI